MDGLIGGIQRFSTEDGPGIRTTVFFTGCPLVCQWCHNPELISHKPQVLFSEQKCLKCGGCVQACPHHAITLDDNGLKIDRQVCRGCGRCIDECCSEAIKLSGEYKPVRNLTDLLLKDKSFYSKTDGGITLSGGEVCCQADYAYQIMQSCLNKKQKVAIDTCGYCKYEDLIKLAEPAQVILYDIKHMDSICHKKLTGVGNELIIANLKALCQRSDIRGKIWIRLPLIHDINDTMENLQAVCKLMNELGLHRVDGLPYHSLGMGKSRKIEREQIEFKAPSEEYLDKIIELFRSHSLDINIMGRQ
ncbi:MAG: glycyl-radical enzyme activating protein [Suipraeoptans sp.]